jgi:hypothetical protein
MLLTGNLLNYHACTNHWTAQAGKNGINRCSRQRRLTNYAEITILIIGDVQCRSRLRHAIVRSRKLQEQRNPSPNEKDYQAQDHQLEYAFVDRSTKISSLVIHSCIFR